MHTSLTQLSHCIHYMYMYIYIYINARQYYKRHSIRPPVENTCPLQTKIALSIYSYTAYSKAKYSFSLNEKIIGNDTVWAKKCTSLRQSWIYWSPRLYAHVFVKFSGMRKK